MKIVVHLHSPEGEWRNVEDATYENENALSAFCIQRVAKILSEGGILEVKGPFSYEFITIHRIKSIKVNAVEQHINLSTDVGSAASESQRAASADKMMRDPIQFKRKAN